MTGHLHIVQKWTALMFDFRGRVSRKGFWLSYLIYAIYIFVIFSLSELLDREDDLYFVLGWLPGAAAMFSVMVRRLHDRARSAWWMTVFFALPLLAFVPFFPLARALDTHRISETIFIAALAGIVTLANIPLWWGFIEMGFLRGTAGKNRFGPDPLVAIEN